MRKIKALIVTVIAYLCCIAASAHDFKVDGIYYNITSSSDLTVSVAYRGSSYNEYSDEYSGSVVIPEKVTYDSKEYSVTSIGYGTFYDCSGLTSVTIPNSVTSIGRSAFDGCSGLTSVTIPNSVTSIGNHAFFRCSGLTSVTIPNSVTSIGYNAFRECSGLTSVTIPNSVTSIGGSAFYGCSGLTSVVIPNSVTSIGSSAFSGCSGLTSVTIPNSVTIIGGWAFSGCSGLTSIYIPESVTRISQEAFYDCSRITRIDCMAATPPLVYNKTFSSSIYSKAIIYVPLESIDLYKSADYWKEFTTIRHSGYVEVKSITFDKATYELEEGDTMNLAVTISPEDATDKTISWKSSNETIATVNDGVVTAIKPGNATITATSLCTPAVAATCKIVVTKKYVSVTGIALDKTKAEMAEGETLKLTATISPEDATDKTVAWTSSDETVATVKDGVVTALKAGKATITAKAGEVSATCELTVNAKVIPATGITLDKTTAELTEGETLTLTATVTPEDATDKTVTWISSDESIAKVINGIVIGVKAGKATIIASCGDKVATCEITVNAKVIPTTGITLDKTTAEMTEGETLTLRATVTPENATDKTVVWTSSDETVATVANGVVTALKAGQVTITAKAGDVSATCEITVNAKVIPATGIALDKTTAEMTEGETLTLTATVSPEDATDKTVTWTSSDETVATVANGVVTALKAGKATITAKSGEVSATCEITINAKVIPATGITLDKTTAEMTEGETLTLTATVTPEDATDKTVTWASSDEVVVKVVNGVVSALKTGKATIIATSGDVSATCEITVIPVTGINGVVCSDGYAAGNVYTVAGNLVCRKGEKLSNLPKGLYIVDGKKIVVK